MDASNLIKPVLAVGELNCIGSTTYQEFRGIFEKDRALARRFQKIDVVEADGGGDRAILSGLRPASRHITTCNYSDEALQAAAELSDPLYQRSALARQGD